MVCKVMKRGLIGAAVGAGALALIFGTAAPSYVRTAFHKAQKTVKGAVPTEFEIERARTEIAALVPALQEGVEVLARAKTEVKGLEGEIELTREEMNAEGRNLQALLQHLKTGDLHLTGGTAYSEKAIKADQARRWDRYGVLKSTLAQKQATLAALKQNVASAEENLDALKTARAELTARVDGAQARLNQIKATRTSHRFHFDDSAVGRARKTVADLEKRLEAESLSDKLAEKYLNDAVTVTPDAARDVTKEVEAEFSSAPAPKVGNQTDY